MIPRGVVLALIQAVQKYSCTDSVSAKIHSSLNNEMTEYNYRNDNIAASGYSIFDLQMDPDHLQNVQDRVYHHPPAAYDPIFRGYKAGVREKKEEIIIEPNRLQSTTITKGTSRDTAWNHLLYKLRTFLPMVRPDLVPKHFAALWSKHPCPKQQDHYDFAPPETSLYSAMLSFDDDTRLTILKKGNHVDLRIPRGFVILFGGHLSHSGSEYLVKDNKRLFFKVMPKGYALKNKEELDVAPKFQECIGKKLGCNATFDNYGIMYTHYIKHCNFARDEVKDNRTVKKLKKSEENKRAREIVNAKKNGNT